MTKTIEITDQNFSTEVEQASSSIPVLVDYWADWCGPCKQLAPIIDKLAEKYDGQVKVSKMDTVAHPNTAAKRGIMGLPTIEIWRDGEVIATSTGSQSLLKLTEMIDEAIG